MKSFKISVKKRTKDKVNTYIILIEDGCVRMSLVVIKRKK